MMYSGSRVRSGTLLARLDGDARLARAAVGLDADAALAALCVRERRDDGALRGLERLELDERARLVAHDLEVLDWPEARENPSDADIDAVFAVNAPPDGLDRQDAAETLRRHRYYCELRDRVQRWFRHHGNKSLKSQRVDPITKVLAEFTQAAFKPPRRLSGFQYYLKTRYEAELKDTVDREFARAQAEAIQAGKPTPKKIAISNPIATRVYEAKSDAFKKEMEEGAEQEYRERLAHHHATAPKNQDPTTAEDYHRELEASQHWLSAFAEHVSRRLGMNITIFLSGPIGQNGGEIGVRCINAGHLQCSVEIHDQICAHMFQC
ncbi:hypothetical protein NUW54_g12641 [Trametes sanguinea]|uniref:Uncharacterized protein n=1 Tax=Trametes sanguinea TaxID=158606 RepID=A0ACC1MVH3_9APHY|nr:hypothetical protein NUW54_g12641 [Trametes sanguinea]